MDTRTRKADTNITAMSVHDYFNFYYDRLITLAVSQFEYHGWPEYEGHEVPGVSRDHLEMCALARGSVAIAKPRGVDKIVALPWIQKGSRRSIYNEVTQIRLQLPDGRFWETDDFYIMYDNALRPGSGSMFIGSPVAPTLAGQWQALGGVGVGSPSGMTLRLANYAKQLAKLHFILNRNMDFQYKPFVVPGSARMRSTIDTFFKEMYSGAPYVKVDSKLDRDTFQVVKTDVPYLVNEMLQSRRELWAEAISILGITSETTKKERLIADEITMNREEDTLTLNSRLMKRMEMVNHVNKAYGLEVTVNLASKATVDPYTMDPFDEQGEVVQEEDTIDETENDNG